MRDATQTASAALVAFDFDGTLTRRDTLLPFLLQVLGWRALSLALLRTALPLLGYALGLVRNDSAKQSLLAAALRGRDSGQLQRLGERFACTLDARLRPEAAAALRRHREAGHRLLLVSASLDCYLVPWAQQQGFEHCLCSVLEVDAQGRMTGRLLGRNCHGPEKRARLRAYLGADARLDYAYGDSRGDWEMLGLAKVGIYRGKAWKGQA